MVIRVVNQRSSVSNNSLRRLGFIITDV